MIAEIAALSGMIATFSKTPLESYLMLPQLDLPITTVSKRERTLEIEFSSQLWQNIVWTHKVLLLVPKGAEASRTAILFITGDGPRTGDYLDLNLLAGATKMPVAMLFNIPNQPLWGMKEDDLIAHSFEKYIETKDSTWPLLFPMTKAAISTMDIVQQVAKNNSMQFDKFVVTGASKRGWTTWLTAATGDKRIAGIAPMVFDNLKFDSQMKAQIEQWGAYSEQIEEYTRRGLQEKLATPSGIELVKMVDPFSYLDRIKVPILAVNGTNDPYWTVDAHQRYWKDVRGAKNLLEVPNSGHGLEDRARVINTVGAFARSMAGEFKMPSLSAKARTNKDLDEITFDVKSSGSEVLSTSIWKVEADTRDFRAKKWIETKIDKGAPVRTKLAKGKWSAAFVECRYSPDGKSFTLSTPVEVVLPK
jgi:PhoPQ-activated pathogenicity-related protein